jgi:hypothetical protein
MPKLRNIRDLSRDLRRSQGKWRIHPSSMPAMRMGSGQGVVVIKESAGSGRAIEHLSSTLPPTPGSDPLSSALGSDPRNLLITRQNVLSKPPYLAVEPRFACQNGEPRIRLGSLCGGATAALGSDLRNHLISRNIVVREHRFLHVEPRFRCQNAERGIRSCSSGGRACLFTASSEPLPALGHRHASSPLPLRHP